MTKAILMKKEICMDLSLENVPSSILYFRACKDMKEGTHRDLSPLYQKFFDNADDTQLIQYALKSDRKAAMATVYKSTLETTGLNQPETNLFSFSEQLIKANKQNPIELRTEILAQHAFMVEDLFNSTLSQSVQGTCIRIFNNLDNCKELKNFEVAIDAEKYHALNLAFQEEYVKKHNDLTPGNWQFLPNCTPRIN
jgi:hypothetical protein